MSYQKRLRKTEVPYRVYVILLLNSILKLNIIPLWSISAAFTSKTKSSNQSLPFTISNDVLKEFSGLATPYPSHCPSFNHLPNVTKPIPVACGLRRRSGAARLPGSRVQIPLRHGCLYLSVVKVQDSATGRSLIEGSPATYVCLIV